MSRPDHEVAYRHLHQKIATAGFAEGTAFRLDYALYVATYMVAARLLTANLSDLLSDSTRAVGEKFELYASAIALVAEAPALATDPRALDELARAAVEAADEYVIELARAEFS
jgi:hypothetical protein